MKIGTKGYHINLNTDTWGLTWKGRYVGDLFIYPYPGLFVNDGTTLRRYRWWPKFELVSIRVIHGPGQMADAARIFRRTMRPYTVLTTVGGKKLEAMSYPFVDYHLGGVYIMVRHPDDPTTLRHVCCERLRPIKYYPRRTGVPSDDPIHG